MARRGPWSLLFLTLVVIVQLGLAGRDEIDHAEVSIK
jgi:hypothetical protein